MILKQILKKDDSALKLPGDFSRRDTTSGRSRDIQTDRKEENRQIFFPLCRYNLLILTNMSAAKAALRKQMKSVLKSLSEEEKRRQSEAAVAKLMELPAFVAARRVSLFLNMPDEVETIPLLRHVLDSGTVS